MHRSSSPDDNPGCAACHATMRDLFPDWDRKVAEADAAGKFKCVCGFVYYLTTSMCPLCSRVLKGRKLDGKAEERRTLWVRFRETFCQIFH